ncbi:MAG: hypothetical protein U0168_00300 [Nannocystaceae bacterium]
MKGWIGWVLLGLSLVVAVAGWRNAQPEPETEAQSRQHACSTPGCTVQGERPTVVRTDVARRQYQWNTSSGPVTVSCKRRLWIAGAWECTATAGAMAQ